MTKVNTKSVLRLVRDAIETYSPDYMHGLPKRDYLKQIDAALAQPEQEPVAHTAIFHCPNCEYPHRQVTHITGTAQPPWSPQRTWVGLTEEEVIDLWPDLIMHRHTYQFWQNLEAKLKEKNHA